MAHRDNVVRRPKKKPNGVPLGERWSAWLRRPTAVYPPSELVAEIRAKYEGKR